MLKKKIIAFISSMMICMTVNSGLISVLAYEYNSSQIPASDATELYEYGASQISVLEDAELIDVDTTVHFRNLWELEEYNYDVQIYWKNTDNGSYRIYRTVDFSSYFYFTVPSDIPEESVEEIVKKHFDLDNDEELKLSVFREDGKHLTHYSLCSTCSQDKINYQASTALFEELQSSFVLSDFIYTPAHKFVRHYYLADYIKYKEEDFDKLSSFIDKNKLPCQVVADNGMTQVRLADDECKKELFYIRETIYKNLGIDCEDEIIYNSEESIEAMEEKETIDFIKLYSTAADSKAETGDINNDGTVDLTDLTELSLALVDNQVLTENQIKAADINMNGKADLTDLATLKQYLSKMITSL